MKIPSINFNLFRTNAVQKTTEQNPFAKNSISNPFAAFTGRLNADTFQNSAINNAQSANFFAQKSAEFVANWNRGLEQVKNHTKQFLAPIISFAGSIRAGFNKMNEITVGDIVTGVKKEISLLSLDKDVRNYVKMPVSELRNQLAQELSM